MQKKLIFLSLILLAINCAGRTPNLEELEVFKTTFLKNRSAIFLNQEWRDYSDQDILSLTCRDLGFNCLKTVELLQTYDPIFYKNIFGEKKEDPNHLLKQ